MTFCIVIFTGHLTEFGNRLFISLSLLPPQLPLRSSNMTQVTEEEFTRRSSLQRHTTVPCFRLTLSDVFNLLTNNTAKKGDWDALRMNSEQWWWLCFFGGNSHAKPRGCKYMTIIRVLSSLCTHCLIILWFALNLIPLQCIGKPTQSLPQALNKPNLPIFISQACSFYRHWNHSVSNSLTCPYSAHIPGRARPLLLRSIWPVMNIQLPEAKESNWACLADE